MLTFGPFCARVILENGCAALVGRLDPFRLMYLSEYQAQPDYDVSKRAKSAFSWTGDVVPDEKQGAMWSADFDSTKITRSLFSRYADHMFWRPAVNLMLDSLGTMSEPLLDDLKQLDAETFIDETKGRCMQLYSSLSKGVHWEFFTSALQYDELTVRNGLRDALLAVANLALVSHYVPTAFSSLDPEDAILAYVEVRKEVP